MGRFDYPPVDMRWGPPVRIHRLDVMLWISQSHRWMEQQVLWTTRGESQDSPDKRLGGLVESTPEAVDMVLRTVARGCGIGGTEVPSGEATRRGSR
jgi:hypothetical protein